jgi:hypothetical protein
VGRRVVPLEHILLKPSQHAVALPLKFVCRWLGKNKAYVTDYNGLKQPENKSIKLPRFHIKLIYIVDLSKMMMMMISDVYLTNMLSWIRVVLAH